MFGIGMPELVIILAIMMILFGAGKLPEIGSGLGRAIKNFKKSVADPETSPEQLEQEIPVNRYQRHR